MNFSLDIIERTEITENTLLISAQFWSKHIEVTVTKLLKKFSVSF